MVEVKWEQWVNPQDGNLCIVGSVENGSTTVAGWLKNGEWVDITNTVLPDANKSCEMVNIFMWAEAPEPDLSLLEEPSERQIRTNDATPR